MVAQAGEPPDPGERVVIVRPYSVQSSIAFVRQHHRRLSRVLSGLWAIALESEFWEADPGKIVGVAIVGRPKAREWDNGKRLEVVRVCVLEGRRNGCSMLYGACARAARAMGATDLLTYTHDDELGTSVKAAGWIQCGKTRGGEWSCKSRERQETLWADQKVRWFAPWSELLERSEW